MKNSYLVTIYAHDRVGLLLRVAQLVARKNLNIERLTLNESAVPGVTWINLVIRTDHQTIQTMVKQLEKQIEVLQAFHVAEPTRKGQLSNEMRPLEIIG